MSLDLKIRVDSRKASNDIKTFSKKAGTNINTLEKKSKTAASGMKKAFSGVSKLIGPLGLTAGFAGLGFAIKGVVGNMVKFESAMAEVSTLVDTNTVNMGALNDKIVDLSTRVPKDAVSLSKGLYQTISAGITDVNDALSLLETASNAAVGGIAQTSDAVKAITTVINAYGKDVSEANDVSDVFFTTIKEGVIQFPQLAQGIGIVASSAALAGVKISEVGAAMATMTKLGIPAEIGFTALNRLFLAIVNPTDQLREKANKLGVEFSAASLRAKGFAGFMKLLTDKFGNNQDAIFELGLDIRAFRALSILGGTGAEEFARQIDNMTRRMGAAKVAAEKMKKTTANTAKSLQNDLNAELLRLNKETLPVTNLLLNTLRLKVKEISDPLQFVREDFHRSFNGIKVDINRAKKAYNFFAKNFKKDTNDLIAPNIDLLSNKMDLFAIKTEDTFSLLGHQPPVIPVPHSEDFVPEFEKIQKSAEELRQELEAIGGAAPEFIKSFQVPAGDINKINTSLQLTTSQFIPELNDRTSLLSDTWKEVQTNIEQGTFGVKRSGGAISAAAEGVKAMANDTKKLSDFMKATGDFAFFLSNSLGTAVINGEKLSKTLENIIKQLASKVLSGLLLGGISALIPGLGFGGFLGGFKSVFGFAGGTNFAPGGPAIVGELGPELVNLPRGSQVVPNSQVTNNTPINISITTSTVDMEFVKTEMIPMLRRAQQEVGVKI